MPNVITKLYVYAAKGAAFKPGSLVGNSAVRADYVMLPNGDAVGVVHATRAQARVTLAAQDGITTLPPLHLPLNAAHVDLFSYAGAASGDTTYELGVKLAEYHAMEWMHPENGPDY